MKKILVFCLLAFSSLFVSAQDNPVLSKDFYKGIRSVPLTFVLNDHINIMGLNLDDENFDIASVNDQMQIVWKITLKGYILSTARFKDKILAVACTNFSMSKRNNNTYKGYLIDPSNGKVLVEKIIFDGPQDNLTFPYVFTADGDFFKFAVRQSGFARKMHVAMPGMFSLISANSYIKEIHETKDLDVIDFNDKLEPIYKFKPVITEGTFLGLTCNNHNDLFIDWYNNGKMDIVKYEAGKDKPSRKITSNVVVDKDILDNFADEDIDITASKKNSNIIYSALVFKNADKEIELGIEKLDFATGQKKYTNEILTKDHIKGIKKSYVTVNKKMDSPDLGPVKTLSVRALKEIDDHLIVALSSTSSSTGMSGGIWISEYNILINSYDTDLNLKFQQLVPTTYTVPERHLPLGFYHDKNKLYVISNDKTGMTTINGTYSVFDLTTGQCDKMVLLSKKGIGNAHAAASASVLWFKNSFVVSYLDLKGFSGKKYDITLQQNSY